MKHRDRVAMALNREEPDRCPLQANFTPEFGKRLRAELGIDDEAMRDEHGGYSYVLERATDQDMLLVWVGWANAYYNHDTPYSDEWGVRWAPVEYTTPYGKGYYTEMVGHPLADDDAIAGYKSPDPDRPKLYTEAARVVETYKDEYWMVGAAATSIFECAWALRGLDALMMDFVADPDLAEAILQIPFQYHLAVAKKLVGLGVDMIHCGDDVGMQTGMMISPKHWRKFLKPKLAQFIAAVKELNPNIKVGYHSDGDIRAIIPELIEIGLDILNPVQPACMDPAEIKRDFGDKLCFWGTMDEQHTLPFGSPADVKNEVLTRLKTIGKGGGLIIGPTHNVQLDTPMENYHAMMDTITKTSYASL